MNIKPFNGFLIFFSSAVLGSIPKQPRLFGLEYKTAICDIFQKYIDICAILKLNFKFAHNKKQTGLRAGLNF